MKIRSSILAAAFLVAACHPAMAALTEMTGIVAISTGAYHSCGITTTGGVKCWGYNGGGALGDGTTFLRTLPVDVVGLDEPVTSISAGQSSTCAILASGRAVCWGRYPTPVAALEPGIAVSSVTVGDYQTCAVTKGPDPPAGSVICWGLTSSGASPEVTFASGGATATAIGSNYVPISPRSTTYYSSTCALVNGGVHCWGFIQGGQSGAKMPVAVPGLTTGVQAISMDFHTVCALTIANGVKCWGYGYTGTPTDVPGLTSGVAAISVGDSHQCVLTVDGGAKCMGHNNGSGQQGFIGQADGIPKDVPGLTSGVVAVGAGAAHSCALLATGGVRCWGNNSNGQLGNGGPFDLSSPPSVVMTGILPRLVGISTRAPLYGRDDVTIAGFIISGGTPKKVVVRAHGPSLASAGVSGALANPTLQLVRSADQSVIATNDDWQLDADAAALQASGFAPHDAKESAIMRTLEPGAYTAIVRGANGTPGVAIVDVYELDQPETPAIAISTRGQVQTGENVMIAGFEIEGDAPQTVLIRALGPSLSAHGVTGVLANPMLQLVRMSDNTVVETNDDWINGPINPFTFQASGLAPANSLESAIYITLEPGQYTAIVSGVGGSTGVALVEVYTR